MAQAPAPRDAFPVLCPHCKKPFEAELLAGSAKRYTGFKCPHCRLFVPHERVEEEPVDDGAAT